LNAWSRDVRQAKAPVVVFQPEHHIDSPPFPLTVAHYLGCAAARAGLITPYEREA
jgi:hypothetical protein